MHDKDGLLPTEHVSVRLGRFYFGGQELFAAPECRGVVDYLCEHEHLWLTARLRFNVSDIRRKSAPIIGVSFGKALRMAYEGRLDLQKSLFQVDGWASYQGQAVIATMLAHTSSTTSEVKFEAWQFLDVSHETFYVHAIIDKDAGSVVHIDGATMLHTEFERSKIVAEARKIKGRSYTKQFRLDGSYSVGVAEALMELYFPVQPLTQEFLDKLSIDEKKSSGTADRI
ncbi:MULTISPECIES: hypothetical protein [Burkholderia]|uniref:hypothetical protein n=1 Tax=Burkholderia TaxID=32008 RepID=UPI002036699D|nr:hypothetical protein [Burkholderia glumae]MCM2549983.1 hypothetical protein [Burkholderia glumae]